MSGLLRLLDLARCPTYMRQEVMGMMRFIDNSEPHLPKEIQDLGKFRIPGTKVVFVPILNSTRMNRLHMVGFNYGFKYNGYWHIYEKNYGGLHDIRFHGDAITRIHDFCETHKIFKPSVLCVGPLTGRSTFEMRDILSRDYDVELDLYGVDPRGDEYCGDPSRITTCYLKDLPVTRKYDIVFWEAHYDKYVRNDVLNCCKHLKKNGVLMMPNHYNVRCFTKPDAVNYANSITYDLYHYIWVSFIFYNIGSVFNFDSISHMDNFWKSFVSSDAPRFELES